MMVVVGGGGFDDAGLPSVSSSSESYSTRPSMVFFSTFLLCQCPCGTVVGVGGGVVVWVDDGGRRPTHRQEVDECNGRARASEGGSSVFPIHVQPQPTHHMHAHPGQQTRSYIASMPAKKVPRGGAAVSWQSPFPFPSHSQTPQ